LQTTRERTSHRSSGLFSLMAGALTVLVAASTPTLTETAVANGDTRTINLYHAHTQESIAATYLVNGQYDQNVLQQLNWFLRDWRRDEPTNMDPRLFDVVWESYRAAGAGNEVIKVVSAYRSPETNAMLRARSRAVAKYSQHMLGKAMDTTMPGMPMSHIREIGMRMQRGGVGYYPTAGTPFVHLDVGNVRSWPRMTYDQLARLFPDGKTVHLPTNGQPLARYEEARAEIEARNNGAYVTAPRRSFGSFLASLFGGGAEEDEDAAYVAPAPSARKQWASLAPRMSKAAKRAGGESDEEGAAPAAEKTGRRGRSEALAEAENNLPRGETALSAAPAEEAAAPSPEPAEKLALARAPLPPRRPSSLTAAFADKRFEVAAVDGANAEAAETPAEKRTTYANVPRPPRRPLHLAVAANAAPTPPTRPLQSAAADAKSGGSKKGREASKALANIMAPSARRNGAEPAAHGERPDRAAPAQDATQQQGALAYAPAGSAETTKDEPPAAGEDAAAGVERASPKTAAKGASKAAAATSRGSGGSMMGSAIGGMRSAARAAQTATAKVAEPAAGR